ncbi:hypothetical protein SAMN05444287_0119 [Octadecabacter temperatus]|uniref:Uncharacterized protein n=2 Tax=Octadecabacter temperatus TaxID=1458307 RepID=A0A0K0Y2A8_9RHOB|nr:hypothetical protein OSB_04680 [Octadecabacter temperatus]SIN84827.1 hypothetical protein SAMN05444287_0119 [Octadecabacter temperatus]
MRKLAISLSASLMFLGACMSDAEKDAVREELFLMPDAGVETVNLDFAMSEFRRVCFINEGRLRNALHLLETSRYTFHESIEIYTDNQYVISFNVQPASTSGNNPFCSMVWTPIETVEEARDRVAAEFPDVDLRINATGSITAFLYGTY